MLKKRSFLWVCCFAAGALLVVIWSLKLAGGGLAPLAAEVPPQGAGSVPLTADGIAAKPSPINGRLDPLHLPVLAKSPNSSHLSGYYSRDPFPVVLALLESRKIGTFGAAHEIVLACLDALIAVSRPPNAFAGDSAVADRHLRLRLEAKQEIEVRCSRFNGQDSLAYSQPLAGDSYGERYREALNVMGISADPERRASAMAELVSQGMSATKAVTSVLKESKQWKGESWQAHESDFHAAVFLAQRLASSIGSAGTADLRDLTACYRGGPCGDFISNSLGDLPESRRERVEALARDMAQALRVNDIEPWGVIK
jgi:hypothetical protein